MVAVRSSFAAAFCLVMVGCVSTGPSPVAFGVRRIENADAVAVFDAALAVLINRGYEIDRADSEAGLILTRRTPDSSSTPELPARLSSRTPRYRFVEVRVERRPDAVQVYCKVAIQEQVTDAHRMFAFDRSGSDLADTPIDREAATTREQNTVWQTVRRDKTEEREILTAILKQS